MAGAVEAKLAALGLELPGPLQLPSSNRQPFMLVGRTLYLSGHGSALLEDESLKRIGKVPSEVSQEEACRTARGVALKMLTTVKQALGDLDRVAQVVKLTGYVNAEPDFEAPNAVINGASDLFYELYGQTAGRHARSTMGVATLVARQCVEIEGIFLVGGETP